MRASRRYSSADAGPSEVLISLLCLLVGLGIVGYVVRADILPLIEARSATLIEVPASLDSARVRRRSDSDGGVTYRPEVRYSYTLEGIEYEGTRLGYGETRWSWKNGKADAQELLEEVRARQPFYVYVDERYHARAVVSSSTAGIINPITLFVGGIGSIFLFVGFVSVSSVAVAKLKRNRTSR